jgi:hypothetical protein
VREERREKAVLEYCSTQELPFTKGEGGPAIMPDFIPTKIFVIILENENY